MRSVDVLLGLFLCLAGLGAVYVAAACLRTDFYEALLFATYGLLCYHIASDHADRE